jgi:hypothetical protein
MNKKTKTILTILGLGALALIALKMLKPKTSSGGGGGGSIGGSNTGGSTNIVGAEPNYNGLAKQIQDSLSGWTEDEQSVYMALKQLRNNNDFDKLIAAFGTREIDSGSFDIFSSNFKGTLSQCLHKYFIASEIAECNTILKNNGITKTI